MAGNIVRATLILAVSLCAPRAFAIDLVGLTNVGGDDSLTTFNDYFDPLQPGVDYVSPSGAFLFDWVDADTFAFQYLLSGDTPGLLLGVATSFSPYGTAVVGASLAGVTLDPVDMVDVASIVSPSDFADYSPALGPTVTNTTGSVEVTFNAVYPDGLHGDQLVWVVDIETYTFDVPPVPVSGTLLLLAGGLGAYAGVSRTRKHRAGR